MTEPTFSDPIAQEYYQEGETELAAAQSAEAVLRKAELCGQKDARVDITQSAFYYLAAAHFLESRDLARSAQAYHQAGYQLHRLDQFTQAGRAYSSAGKLAERAAGTEPDEPTRHHLQHLAVRSYSRANHCFAEAGELEWSEAEYLNERNARVTWAQMQGKHPWAQLAWKATSNYGTSFARWGVWVLGTIGTFSVLYEIFFRLHWLEPMETAAPVPWVPLWSGIYYSVNITSALGLVDYQPSHFISQGVVIANVLVGYLLLGVGIGIIGRMIKTRG
jgi:hypothetical protein